MPKQSTEYRRGDLHRHHHFDYHAVVMHHHEEYHDCIKETVYENMDFVKADTKIGKLVRLAYKAVVNIHIYHVVNGPVKDDVYTYLLHNTETNGNYNVDIKKDGTYRCNCPDFIRRGKTGGVPCKHVVIVACVKGHDINL